MTLNGFDPNRWHFDARLELYYPFKFGVRTDLFFWNNPQRTNYMIWPIEAYRPDGSELTETEPLMEAEWARFMILVDESAEWLFEYGLSAGFVFGIHSYDSKAPGPSGLVQVMNLNPDWTNRTGYFSPPSPSKRR